MKNIFAVISVMTILAGCNLPNIKNNDRQPSEIQGTATMHDSTPKVTGVGGIFFFSDHPEEIKAWYGKNLKLEIIPYGSTFAFRNADRPDEMNYLQWSPFTKGSNYFSPSKKEFMINYRVQNIEGLVKQLKANGVTIADTIGLAIMPGKIATKEHL